MTFKTILRSLMLTTRGAGHGAGPARHLGAASCLASRRRLMTKAD